MKYIYYDEIGNKYEINSLQISYDSIKTKESSSGSYNGGNPHTKALNKLEYIKFVDALERAIWNKEDHSIKKEMGCSLIRKLLNNELVSQVYLKHKSEATEEIYNLIKSVQ